MAEHQRLQEQPPLCPKCGQQNLEGFRFCGACGAELADKQGWPERRKTVTVLFATSQAQLRWA